MISINILTKTIISNSDIIKNYKICREKADGFGKIFVFKNNQPDAVLFSISEYERLSLFVDYSENLDSKDISEIIKNIPQGQESKKYFKENLLSDIGNNLTTDNIEKFKLFVKNT